MTRISDFDAAVRNALAEIRLGGRIETLALATTLIAQLELRNGRVTSPRRR